MASQITLQWPGGEHDFALPLGHLRAVQDACNAGPMEILLALRAGSWRVDMPMSVLRHGLIGAGMQSDEARRLVDGMFETHPYGLFIGPAMLVMGAALMGAEDDPVGEPEGAMSPPESSSSVPSTKAARKPASRRARSTR